MIWLAIAFIVAASFASRSRPLLAFGVFYAVLQAAHYALIDGSTAWYAYTAMTADLLCLFALAFLSVIIRSKWQLLPLSIIMFLSVINGYYGLSVFNSYGDVELVNTFGFLIYIAVIAGLLWGRDIGRLVGVGADGGFRNRAPLRRLARTIKGDS